MALYVLNMQAVYDGHVKTRTHNVANLENTAQRVNAVCENRQTIFSLSMVMNMCVGTIQAIIQDLGYCKVCSQ